MFRSPKSYSHSFDPPSTSFPSTSVTLCSPILLHLSPLCPLYSHLTHFFPSPSPSLILLWPESQGRWSMQADAPHPVSRWEKQRLDPKQTKSAGGCPRESGEVHGTINPGYDRGPAFLLTGTEEAHRWSHKKYRPTTKDFFQSPILMIRSTLDVAAVGLPLRPSDVPDRFCLISQTMQI